ncbi:MAG: DNA replication and repair protein RecF [Fretibacterium sp.]|nr:DNA replication and repair protein RecF [Fretibacterium sp.]
MIFELSVVKDFRSLRGARIEWAPGLNLILGPNGSGKTNLLESLNVLAGWGTFHGRTSGAVSWDSERGRALLGARVTGEEGHELQVQVSTRMTPRIDGKHATFTDLRLAVPSITFLPNDINLVEGSPAVRRLFLDRLCALCFPPYARRLSEFHQVSRHRTALLRQGRPVRGTTLPFARLGGWVMEMRRRVASLLLTLEDSTDICSKLPFSFSMTPALGDSSGEEKLLRLLEETSERERYVQRPLVGPNRDDLEITSLGRPASESLSRGQKRRLVLSLILRSGRLIELQLRRKPVLLFDDLAAELDAAARRETGMMLQAAAWQIFVTGTEDPFEGFAGTKHFLPLTGE